ncbi:MAG: hypothetical protein R3C68_04520 [Myxococcota bacterium]
MVDAINSSKANAVADPNTQSTNVNENSGAELLTQALSGNQPDLPAESLREMRMRAAESTDPATARVYLALAEAKSYVAFSQLV